MLTKAAGLRLPLGTREQRAAHRSLPVDEEFPARLEVQALRLGQLGA